MITNPCIEHVADVPVAPTAYAVPSGMAHVPQKIATESGIKQQNVDSISL